MLLPRTTYNVHDKSTTTYLTNNDIHETAHCRPSWIYNVPPTVAMIPLAQCGPLSVVKRNIFVILACMVLGTEGYDVSLNIRCTYLTIHARRRSNNEDSIFIFFAIVYIMTFTSTYNLGRMITMSYQKVKEGGEEAIGSDIFIDIFAVLDFDFAGVVGIVVAAVVGNHRQ